MYFVLPAELQTCESVISSITLNIFWGIFTDESASLETLKNCLRAFEHMMVLEKYVTSVTPDSNDVTPGSSSDVTRMIRLQQQYKDSDLLQDFIIDIETYFD